MLKTTDLPSLNLSRIFILNTANTCSASEAFINGLRGIDVEVVLIGQTRGKPYGSTRPIEKATPVSSRITGTSAKYQRSVSSRHQTRSLLGSVTIQRLTQLIQRGIGNANYSVRQSR
ncbi:hypothetical protein ALON55S_08132 [Alishewanella longhuensis]